MKSENEIDRIEGRWIDGNQLVCQRERKRERERDVLKVTLNLGLLAAFICTLELQFQEVFNMSHTRVIGTASCIHLFC